MANAGALILTNTNDDEDIAGLQDTIARFDITSVDGFGLAAVSGTRWLDTPEIGWHGTDRAGWFFGGRTTLPSLIPALAEVVRPLGTR